LKKEHNRDFEEGIHGFDESKAMENQKKHEGNTSKIKICFPNRFIFFFV
jgi:hypothetical protein